MNIGAIALIVRAHDARNAAYRLALPVSDRRCRARTNTGLAAAVTARLASAPAPLLPQRRPDSDAHPCPLRKEDTMPEPVAPHPDPATTTRPLSSPDGIVPPMPFSSPDGIVPPMPSEVTNAHGAAGAGRWRTATMPLRKMMRRTPRGAA
jgi:hypothetical protein